MRKKVTTKLKFAIFHKFSFTAVCFIFLVADFGQLFQGAIWIDADYLAISKTCVELAISYKKNRFGSFEFILFDFIILVCENTFISIK